MNNSRIYKRLYKDYSKKYLSKIILSGFFSILVAGSTSAIAWLLDPAIKKLFIEKDLTLIFFIPLMIVLAFATKGLSLYYAKITMISVGAEVTKKLQYDMMQNLIGTDTEVIDKKHSGKFISNITYDVNHITNLLSNAILALFKDTFTLLGLLSVMFLQNWKLATISIIMIPLASFSAKILGKRMGKVTTEAQVKSGILTTYLVELFKNHKLMKIFQKENYEKNRAYNYLTQLKEKNQKINTIFVRMSPIMEVLTGIMIATLIFYSGILISRGELDINNFFSFLAAMMLAYQPVRSLSALNMTFKQGLSAAERILPIIDKKNNIQDDANARPIVVKNSNIEFIDVNFSYENEKAQTLNTINMQFEGGKMTSLVGNSGAGKSTIMNLIPRFYDINSGDITIDNQSIYKTKINSLREQISMVSQETTLFDDTVGNNIKYANQDATEEEVYQVAKASFCEEFINKLPNKFGTLIGENGVRISGGEKQRISIARAMLKKSSIILLDEATSSLDSETESKIQKALNILTKDKTTIVIAHRLSTILNSNNIYLIESGKVIDSGRHEELLTKSKIYKNFYEKQIQK
tara:strand:+ start:846 stop:2582 length:1737 start_codon:yes stop_codon:yes gene_type:complete